MKLAHLFVLTLLVFNFRIFLFAGEPTSAAAVLKPYVERHELAGAVVCVVNRESILVTDSIGYADIEAARPMQDDTLFWIASQSKPMTSVAVMMLVDEGKLTLDDPVEKFLPEFRGQMVIIEKDDKHRLLKKPTHPITVREVLSHMSGMPFQSALEQPTLDGLPLAVAVKSYGMTSLESQPGTRYQYSNAGINTAARIIEVIEKRSFESFMQERLFDPLAMKDTTFWPNSSQVERLAKSYRPDANKTGLEPITISQLIYPLTDREHRFPMPAGGLFSTASDTARFCQMLLRGGELNGHRLLSESAFAELTKRQTPVSVKESYGLGLSVGNGWFGHGGAYATNMEIHVEKGLALVWMVQHAGYPGEGGQVQGTFKEWAWKTFAH